MTSFEEAICNGVSKDAVKVGEERVQKLTDAFIARVDELFVAKAKDSQSVKPFLA